MNHFTHPYLITARAGRILLLFALLFIGRMTFAQVTTSAISGIVTDKAGEGLARVGGSSVFTRIYRRWFR